MEYIKTKIDFYINENLDYQNEPGHTAPKGNDKTNAPLYDLTKIYPDDIYSSDAIRLYGEYSDDYSDAESISIIQSCRNRPNEQVKVYRAVPDFNYDIDKKLKELNYILNYKFKYRFFPPNNKIVNELEEHYNYISNYVEMQKAVEEDIINQIDEIKKSKSKNLKINNGDWITINKDYAKIHGITNLKNRYKILTKTTKAKYIFSEGNSIHEFGLDENDYINESYLPSDAIGYDIGEYLYHITPIKNLNKIKNNGFVPKDGISINGKPFKNRLYFATSLIAAYDLSVNFQSYRDDVDEYVIFKVDSKCLKDYEEDELFKHGIYVNYPISKKYIVDIINAEDLFGKFDEDDFENLY